VKPPVDPACLRARFPALTDADFAADERTALAYLRALEKMQA
jgi:hypothetical protein